MKIVSENELRVTTMAGAAIVFQAGEPITVADEIGLLAIQMGAKEYNKKYVEEANAEEAVFDEVLEVKTIDANLVTMLEKMLDEGDPKNFKADGYPKAAAVNKEMGVTVDTDEREAAWESILNS